MAQITSNYKYPTKLKKFGIDDPFLNMLVAKYENEIIWQSVVKNTETLEDFVKNEMLSALFNKADLDKIDKKSKKHYFITSKHINLEATLADNQDANMAMKFLAEIILKEGGRELAKEGVTSYLNERKRGKFKIWIDFMQLNYKKSIAFQLLILRSVFELSGYGVRRVVDVPNKDVIEWLYMRINKGLLTPDENLSKKYNLKLAFGDGYAKRFGWIHIPEGVQNAKRLASTCSNSGWCVQVHLHAESYLKRSSFYILLNDYNPVLALRVQDKQVKECQGRHNTSPLNKHWHDAHFFTSSLELQIADREEEYREGIKDKSDYNSLDWWEERVRLWHFAIDYVPEDIKLKLNVDYDINNTINFFPINLFWEKLKIKPSVDELLEIIDIDPYIYDKIPESFIASKKELFTTTYIAAFIEKLEASLLTFNEIANLPALVKESINYKKAIKQYIKGFHKKILRTPRRSMSKTKTFKIDTFLNENENERKEDKLLRFTNTILNICNSDFSDNIFSNKMKESKDFADLKEQAWVLAIKEDPCFRLALPYEYKNKKIFDFDRSKVNIGLLYKWVRKVEEKPWLLTQKNKVPKTVKYREEILRAYINAWKIRITKTPWQLGSNILNVFKKIKGRVYLSFPALNSYDIIKAQIQGFLDGFEKGRNYWRWAEAQDESISAIQFSVLMAATKANKVIDIEIKTKSKNGDIFHKNISDLKTGGAIKLYFNFIKNSDCIKELTKLEEFPDLFRKIKTGDKLRIKLGDLEISCSMCVEYKGYQFIKRKSPEYKSLLGLKLGDEFDIGETKGIVMEFMN